MMRAEADYKAWQEDDRHLGGGLQYQVTAQAFVVLVLCYKHKNTRRS